MAFDFKSRPTGVWKWLLHMPTWLFRARLGFVFGKRMVMIEHRGRSSGRRYRTVVEVAGRGSEGDYIVTSGTGPRADWYRNILADGLEAVWIGSRRRRATARSLSPKEASPVFAEYERAHPKAAAILMERMGVAYDGTDEGRIEMMRRIPMLAFTVT
ncbi:MAG: nitroreductase family deazaflavin-dependent oxidoreductase [Acidimicrobiia bacterium]